MFNGRFFVLLFSVCLSIGIYFYVISTNPPGIIQTIKLTQFYALTSITYLYFALLASPFSKAFPKLFLINRPYIYLRRAIGVSAFYFATLHAYNAFFKVIGGLEGLLALDSRYALAISLSSTALLILTIMASTSFDKIVAKLGYARWKILHRLVYVAGISVLTHALLIGSHFRNLSEPIPVILLVALIFLFTLETKRFASYLVSRKNAIKKEPQVS